MKIRIIGDIHGKLDAYNDVIKNSEYSIQVGDFGIGFGEEPKKLPNKEHKFIRGNHDNLHLCKNYENWIPDGTVWNNEIMFIGGAKSIDRGFGRNDWWEDEELSIVELNNILDIAKLTKPKIIISHACPLSIIPTMFGVKPSTISRTEQFLDILVEEIRPELMIFGHWHIYKDMHINYTRFVCLGELNYIDIEISPISI